MNPAKVIEFLVVGRTPLGGALRAGLIGVAATMIGTWFFIGSFGPFVVGSIVVVILLPVAYAISRRDDAHGAGDATVPPAPSPGRPVPPAPDRKPPAA